jgi:predicted amidohydrolase
MKDLRIAAAVCRSPVGQVQRNLEDLIKWVGLAKKEGVQLICFPELNLTGYCTRADAIPPAITCQDPIVDKIVRLAISENIIILTGLVEAGKQGHTYISHLMIAPDGTIGVYRKLHLAPPERGLYTPGETVPVFKAAGITFGIQLCYDAHFPELSSYMSEMGAEVIFFPHASPRGNALEKHHSWMRHLPARAFDNGIYVVACNQVGDNCNQLTFPGNALVLGPSGNVIKRSVAGEEGLLIVDLQEAALKKVRNHPMRYFFPNRRPELYI